ncbi:MAG: hypothetical protein K2R98_00720 [Gemmataceae bacterium]|nr:hypothetical protein [Gemmataceae bacterium]
MPIYFLLLDGDLFEREIVRPLAASWQQRSFEPCRALTTVLGPALDSFRAGCFAGTEEPLLLRVSTGLPFDRHIWRLLVGELLLIAAAEVPEIETAPDVLCCLLAPDRYAVEIAARDRFAPIQQAHFGSRDLAFSRALYRPDHAGWNDRADTARLADYLSAVQSEEWRVEDLGRLRGVDERDRAEELEFAREWFPALRDVYRRARERGQVVVCEVL